jgi:hypothetical protein
MVQTNAMLATLSSTLEALTPQSIAEANGNFKVTGTWDPSVQVSPIR